MRLLALDLGSVMGWCRVSHTKAAGFRWESGTVNCHHRSNESAGMRIIRARAAVREFLAAGVDAVVFEDVKGHKGTAAAHLYGALLAVVQEECDIRIDQMTGKPAPIPYFGVGVGVVKRRATGKGNAKKELVVAAAQARWPELAAQLDDNEADARWIAVVGWEQIAPHLTPI